MAHEVYFRILRLDSKRYAEIENPEAYLFTIARNLLAERAKALQRRGVSCGLDELEKTGTHLGPASAAGPTEAIRDTQIAAIIEGLKPRLRAVMIMRYRYGMSYNEMAGHLDVSSHSIKKYLSEALHLCRRAMKQSARG